LVPRTYRFICVLLFLSGVSNVTVCRASPVLDQSFTGPNNAAAFINEAAPFVAQIYTAGVSGTLASISVDVSSSDNFSLRVSIRAVKDGMPTSVVLGETLLASSSAALSQSIAFAERIEQIAGQQYAIALDYPSQPSPAILTNRWAGASGNTYVKGSLALSLDGVNWFIEMPATVDLHFQTVVNAVSEAPVAALLAIGALVGLRRGRHANHPGKSAPKVTVSH
jgi:hypothetical protein